MMTLMNSLKSLNSLKYWFAIFFLMSAVNWHDGGPNAASRFAALQAMTELHTFEITPFKEWTIDWSQTPDGKIYSNKAPGPMLIAFPAAWLMNRAKVLILGVSAWMPNEPGDIYLVEPAVAYRTVICWLFQIIPFCFLVAWSANWLKSKGASLAAIHYSVIALLFGSTLSFMLDVYFGHAVSAWALLAMLLYLSNPQRNYAAAGFFFGLSMLSDYGTVFLVFPFLALIWIDREKSVFLIFRDLLLGGLVPLAFFAWYHTACFGHPWALPMRFQNPLFVDASATRPKIWGVVSPFPDPVIFLKLCFGMRRGILFTQPWMWVAFASTLYLAWTRKLTREAKAQAVFCLGGFFCLLWMNAGFNGWHGGGSPGPRYMSIIFPAIALFTGVIYDRVPSWTRNLLWLTLGVSVLLRIAGYSGQAFAPEEQKIWSYVIGSLVHNRLWFRGAATLTLLIAYFTWAGLSVRRFARASAA